jgi:Fur family transcriptional regulator, ferric uptake regulator
VSSRSLSYDADVTPSEVGESTSTRALDSSAAAGRQTRQKRALARVIDESDQFLSAQQLHAQLRARGEHVGLTTVYSQLRSLTDAGLLNVVRTDDGEMLYRRCETEDHHHHLVCRQCGATAEVQTPDVEAWATGVAALYGYRDVTHTFAIIGTCRECAAGV